MTIAFTICSNNYLAQAISLGNSLMKNNPEYIFKIGLVDRKNILIDYNNIPFEIVEVENIGIEDLDGMILRYNIQELNTAVKPFFFNYFLNLPATHKNIIYLDPDILVYSPFSVLDNELLNNDIVITPHITMPLNDGKLPSENDFLNTGLYNLGFIAIRVSSISRKMINWWSARLKDKGYNDVQNGMFTDQIWINFVPLFFEKVKIFTHPGYNMAYWNFHERKITRKDSQPVVNEIFPLVFFHFSGFSPNKAENISKYQTRYNFKERDDILPFFLDYSRLLEINKYNYYRSFTCCYSGVKERFDEDRVLRLVRKIPLWKRVVKKNINYLVRRFDILLDYSVFYRRENSDSL